MSPRSWSVSIPDVVAASWRAALLTAPLWIVATAAAQRPVRRTTAGLVAGVAGTVADRWLGIPYAAPPLGVRRWRAPEPPIPWDGVRASDRHGNACVQLGGLQGPGRFGEPFGPGIADSFGKPVGDEDCLTLNVWRPKSRRRSLPVVVFVHGGANVAGYAADPLYDGSELSERLGALVVTLNYRLGVLGWFRHPEVTGTADPRSASGNFGLLDIAAALTFIRANARAFGGDGRNVTAIGQSAGAVNLYSLLASPFGRGLFNRAVLLSGAAVSIPAATQDAYGARVVDALLVADGLATDSASARRFRAAQPRGWADRYLRGKSGSDIVRVAGAIPGGGLPTEDGVVVPTNLLAALGSGQVPAIPLLVGRTREEGKFFLQAPYRMTEAERWRRIVTADPTATPPSLAQVLEPAWATKEQFEAAAAETTKGIVALIEASRATVAATMPVYALEFAWAEQEEPWRTLVGAAHGIDLAFLFQNFGPSLYGASFTKANEPGRKRLAAGLAATLRSFMRTDRPSAGMKRVWVAGGAAAVFGAPGSHGPPE